MIVDLRQGVVDNGASHLDDGTPVGKCVSQEPHQQIWIGVLLVLIGGATLNIGLNLQKYAFRKREEKMRADAVVALHNSVDKEKIDAIARTPSRPNDVYFYSSEVVSGHRGVCAAEATAEAGQRSFSLAAASDVFPLSTISNVRRTGTGAALSENRMNLSSPTQINNNKNSSGSSSGSSSGANGIAEISHLTANRISLSAMDSVRLSYCSDHRLGQKPRAQDTQSEVTKRQMWKTKLRQRMALRKNANTPFSSPAWAVGLVIFILGNVVNFVALQFAPQSLVAPLGAVSLVTNVIVAPLLNKEKISMFDVGGIVLIIAGCVVVVVFSGIVQQNYRLCVLIQLLKSKPTVVYLCLIFGAILAIYVFLWSVERGVARYLQGNHQLDDAGSDMHAENSDLDHLDSCHLMTDEQQQQQRQQHNKWPLVARQLESHQDPVDKEDSTVVGQQTRSMQDTGLNKHMDLDANNSTAKQRSIDKLFTELGATMDHCNASDSARAAGPFILTSPKLNDNNNNNEMLCIQSPQPIDQHTIPTGNSNSITGGRPSMLGRLSDLVFRHPLMILDPYIRPIRPTSRYVKYGLPLAYASLGSFMATLTTLFAKSLVNLLSVSLFDHDNQFNHFISWAILLVTAFTAASQVYWINQGLLRYDALLQVPVFYVVWTVFDIIGGGVYFNEFRYFTTVKYVLFALGVAVIFSGVGLLSHRMRGT
ncbi:hypothetical protein LPJ56_000168 [Coemansia sp. RSA 2599]|nr:hypothetical protein LPJ75_000024 [Coemansia sp. RSA 2598]KAJ1829649.1 hypothetical protein LPJ56_000168 [Coemansia sp. RSA 2599]